MNKVESAMSKEALRTSISELERELFLLRDRLSVERRLERPHLLKQTKRERARALTFLSQKERAEVS